MDDAAFKKWDLTFKWIGLFVALIGASWTYYKFRDDRKVDLEHQRTQAVRDEAARLADANAFIFQRQTALYFEAARSAATIAAAGITDPKLVKEARQRFAELYFGELVIVEDRRVELAMISFYGCDVGHNCERRGVNKYGKPLDPKKLSETYGEPILPNLSLELAACIRSALQEDRKVQFGATEIATTSCPYD